MLWSCPRCAERIDPHMTTCSRCGAVRGEDPVAHPFDPAPKKLCPYCKAEVSGPAIEGQLRCAACAAQFPDYEEWVRQCRLQAYSAWPRPRVAVEPPPTRPGNLKAQGWGLIALVPVNLLIAVSDGGGPLLWIAAVLGALQIAAGAALLREVRAAGLLSRLAAGLSAPLLFPMGGFYAVFFEHFSRPNFARYFGARPDPVPPRVGRHLLGWVAGLAAVLLVAFLVLVPRSLATARAWDEPLSPAMGLLAMVSDAAAGHRMQACLRVVFALFVLAMWGRISRVGFFAVGAAALVLLILVGGPAIGTPVLFDVAADRAMDLERAAHAPTLMRGLGDSEPMMRIAAARGMEAVGRDAESGAAALVKSLEDPDRRVRLAAACALGRLDPKAAAAVPVLAKALKEEGLRPEDRRRVTAALARFGPRARPALWILLDGLATDDGAAEALSEIGGPAIPGLVEAMSHAEAAVRRRAAVTLGRIGPPARSAVDALQSALKDKDAAVRAESVRSIAEIQGAKAVPQLELLLEDPALAKAAAEALCWLGEREGLPALTEGSACLNVIRRPSTCDHLRRTLVDGDLEGSVREILEQLGAKAGMKVQVAAAASFAPAETESLGRFRRLYARPDRRSVLDTLKTLDVEFIVETDALRILPVAEARRYWAAWLAAERGG